MSHRSSDWVETDAVTASRSAVDSDTSNGEPFEVVDKAKVPGAVDVALGETAPGGEWPLRLAWTEEPPGSNPKVWYRSAGDWTPGSGPSWTDGAEEAGDGTNPETTMSKAGAPTDGCPLLVAYESSSDPVAYKTTAPSGGACAVVGGGGSG